MIWRPTDRRWADWSSKGTLLDPNYINSVVTQTLLSAGKTYVAVPDWKVKIAKGLNANGAYAREGIEAMIPARYTCRSRIFNGLYDSRGSGTVQCGSLHAMKAFEPLEEKAAGRIKHKLSGYIGNAQLAAPIAESREIHRLVRQINGLGMDTLKAMLAAKKTKGKSLSKLVGDAWLGYGFGVNPLLRDIKSAADSILKYVTRQDQRVVVRAVATDEWTSGSTDALSNCCYGGGLAFTHSAFHKQSVLITAGIDLTTRSSASYSVADHLGLKLGALPSTLWELTPYSWVIDYFTTVSPWLDDMFYTLPGTTKYIASNRRYRVETYGGLKFGLLTSFTGEVSGAGTESKVVYFNFSRNNLANLPSQSIRIKSADEIAFHGLTKLLNLSSVIAGRHGGSSLR